MALITSYPHPADVDLEILEGLNSSKPILIQMTQYDDQRMIAFQVGESYSEENVADIIQALIKTLKESRIS